MGFSQLNLFLEAKEDFVVAARVLNLFFIYYLAISVGALCSLMVYFLVSPADDTLEVLLVMLHAQVLILRLCGLHRAHCTIPPLILLHLFI